MAVSYTHLKIFVDASGDCDIAFLAGLEPNKGREGDGKCQPMTMNFKVINVDTERVKKYIMTVSYTHL